LQSLLKVTQGQLKECRLQLPIYISTYIQHVPILNHFWASRLYRSFSV